MSNRTIKIQNKKILIPFNDHDLDNDTIQSILTFFQVNVDNRKQVNKLKAAYGLIQYFHEHGATQHIPHLVGYLYRQIIIKYDSDISKDESALDKQEYTQISQIAASLGTGKPNVLKLKISFKDFNLTTKDMESILSIHCLHSICSPLYSNLKSAHEFLNFCSDHPFSSPYLKYLSSYVYDVYSHIQGTNTEDMQYRTSKEYIQGAISKIDTIRRTPSSRGSITVSISYFWP